ncbi:MAG: DUF2116 family Zn-ribbon domain-containing protein [Thermoplasmata archaeon]
MVERIPQHRHCQFCDKAISIDKKYCDDNCEVSHKTAVKAKRRQLMMFYILMIIVFVVALLLSL